MKLLYTDVRTPLTQVLTQEAVGLVEDGKRVFYIAPNSLSFEKEGIEATIAEGVPADKIISGVPFYTRLWKTDTNGEVSSEAIGMDRADATLEANGVTANWSDETSQDYAEYHDPDGALYQIWLENEASIELKAKLVPEYQLAGIAAWKLGFERSSIWDVISTNIK